MKRFLFLFLVTLVTHSLPAQSFTLLSWNIRDLSKTKDDTEIQFMAQLIHDYDIIAIQEVVAGYGGAQAVARLADAMNRKGGNWDYRISDPTKSNPYQKERYAYIWNRKKIKLINRPWLKFDLADLITREPYLARFQLLATKDTFLVLNFHSIPWNKQPEQEAKYLKFLPKKYQGETILFAGDYNMPDDHTVFNPLKKMGYAPILQNVRTTINKKRINPDGTYFGHPIDNIFYDINIFELIESARIDFVPSRGNLKKANMISDHLPVWGEFEF